MTYGTLFVFIVIIVAVNAFRTMVRVPIAATTARRAIQQRKTDQLCKALNEYKVINKLFPLGVSFFSLPLWAVADTSPISVFEDVGIRKGTIEFLATILFFAVPYYILNEVIAPRLGLVKNEENGDERASGKNPWE